jgi:hypothetical protein
MASTTGAAGCQGWMADLGKVKGAVDVSFLWGCRSIIGVELRFNPNILPVDAFDDGSLYGCLKSAVEHGTFVGHPTVASSAHALSRGHISITIDVSRQSSAENVARAAISCLNELRSNAEKGEI